MHKVILIFASYLSLTVQSEEVSGEACGIWLAKSTIPGAGLGMFAGTYFEKGKRLLPIGDIVIPIVDMDLHQGDDFSFLWDEYTWDGKTIDISLEGISDELVIASPGFGAAINCYMDLINVEEVIPAQDSSVFNSYNRWINAGAGAFSPYWNRTAVAVEDINAGDELFASYGNAWFTSRKKSMALVPLKGDLARGNNVISRFAIIEGKLTEEKVDTLIFQDLWKSFIWNNPWGDTSRVLSAIPKKWEDIRFAANYSLQSLKRMQHSVTVDWLEENGECGDWITAGLSTLPEAGHGAFGRKSFKAGEIVVPLPLIHIPYREVLDMFYLSKSGRRKKNNQVFQKQLLENYCMGHRESTLLLCPYGTLSNYINHNRTMANVRLEWADPSKSIHSPSWLEKSIIELSKEYSAGLSMNVIASRDINEGDEIFLDYGDEWDKLWEQHLRSWTPNPNDRDYKSADYFNLDMSAIRTEKEQEADPYPAGVNIYFRYDFVSNQWKHHWKNGTLDLYLAVAGNNMYEYVDVSILNRVVDREGHTWYDLLVYKSKHSRQRVKKVPKESLRFFDEAYSTDMFQPHSFRHDIRIPDSIFPDAWKNLRDKKSANEKEEPKTDTLKCEAIDSCFNIGG